MAWLNTKKAHYAQKRLSRVPGVRPVYQQPFFNEFVIELSRPAGEVNQALLHHGMIGGYDLGKLNPAWEKQMLMAVTEVRTKEEIDQLAERLEEIL
ncbi:putative glycine dehydrogenase (decarboxylating) subunit 1 [compost metagenome]